MLHLVQKPELNQSFECITTNGSCRNCRLASLGESTLDTRMCSLDNYCASSPEQLFVSLGVWIGPGVTCVTEVLGESTGQPLTVFPVAHIKGHRDTRQNIHFLLQEQAID